MKYHMHTGETVAVKNIRGFMAADGSPRVVCDLLVTEGVIQPTLIPTNSVYSLTIQELVRNGVPVRAH